MNNFIKLYKEDKQKETTALNVPENNRREIELDKYPTMEFKEVKKVYKILLE